jgi:hypothetical protein
MEKRDFTLLHVLENSPDVLNVPWFSDETHFRMDIYRATQELSEELENFIANTLKKYAALQTVLYKFLKCVE